MSRWPLILALGACALHLTVLGLDAERTYRAHTARPTPAPNAVTVSARADFRARPIVVVCEGAVMNSCEVQQCGSVRGSGLQIGAVLDQPFRDLKTFPCTALVRAVVQEQNDI